MQRVLIDMDDVMADTSSQILLRMNELTGKNYTEEKLKNKALFDQFMSEYASKRNFLHEKGFFENIPLMPHSQEVIAKIQEKYEVFVVSAATEFPNSLSEKMTWLERYFPNIGWKHTVFCGHKYQIKGDYLIDDHIKNFEKFEGKALWFNAFHNNFTTSKYQKVHSWLEIAEILEV